MNCVFDQTIEAYETIQDFVLKKIKLEDLSNLVNKFISELIKLEFNGYIGSDKQRMNLTKNH